MPARALCSLIAAKSVLFSWIVAAAASFGFIENQAHDYAYAAVWAAISALGAAAIAGGVKVCVSLISTSRSRREQRQIEREAELKGWHKFYGHQLAFKDDQLKTEMNILRIVRNSKHALISDVGARDMYIYHLEELLRNRSIAFEPVKFRNMGDAFIEEDLHIAQIVQQALSAPPLAAATA